MRILRGVGSQVLPCGCLVGLYETYDGRSVAILDAQDEECPRQEHRQGFELNPSQLRVPGPAAAASSD